MVKTIKYLSIWTNFHYLIISRTMSFFIPGNAETIIDYDCVPTYSQTLAAQIIDINDNVIIPQTTLKSGTIAYHRR